jgi:mRNA interferase MazF
MFNKFITKKTITEENTKKDFKKLANYVLYAKGHRTINGFSADCKTNPNYLADIINGKINSYPTVQFLKIIAENSEGRVSLKELTMACGYSNYENNDIREIINIHVRRGWFAYANFGESLDSEYGGYRVVLVVQNDIGNSRSSTTIVLPVTSRRTKSKMPTHVEVSSKESGLPKDSIISCEQIRCISKRRLIQRGYVQKISEASLSVMERVEIAMGKAQGSIKLHVDEQEAIQALYNLNNVKQYQYETNYNTGGQLACAF